MKTLLIFTALLISNLANAGELRSYDCNKGDDGLGGYYCHYDFIKCAQASCEEAAKCIVEKTAREREGKKVTVYVADTTPVSRDGEKMKVTRLQRHEENCNGRQCLTPMFVYTRIRLKRWGYKAGMCEPVAIHVIGDDSFQN